MCLTMRTRTHLLAVAATLTAAGLCAATAQARGDDLLPGEYAGKGSGIKTTITVDDLGDAVAKFTMKTSCGNVKGSLDLTAAANGDLKGKRVAGMRTITGKVSPTRRGGVASGWIRYAATGEEPCKGKRSFDAKLDMANSPLVDELSGSYSGEGDDGGLPISFEVGYDKSEGVIAITDVAFQTDTECWNDVDGDGDDETLVANVSGLSGEVDPDGYFEIDFTPDDDTELYVDGQIEDGEAELYVEVGGFWAADGTPQAGGPLECDSWGEDYFATRNG